MSPKKFFTSSLKMMNLPNKKKGQTTTKGRKRQIESLYFLSVLGRGVLTKG